jgi:type I restriction enzyme S subunit
MTAERWPLPSGWKWVTAKDIGKIVGGGTPTASDATNFAGDDGVPWITPADLTGYEETYIGRGRRNLSRKGLASCGATVMPAGTVLYSSRAPIGYCAIAANPISTNQGFKSLVLRDGIVPEFIRYYLLSSKEYAEGLASGTTFKELSGARMSVLPVPLAPEKEQRRIVAKLDSLSGSSRDARDELSHIPGLVERYRQAVLESAFRGDLAASWGANRKPTAKWTKHSLFELCDPRRGLTYGVIKLGEEVADGIPCLRTSNVRWLRIDSDSVKKISPALSSDYARTILRGGEVLVNVRGTLGGVAVVTSDMVGWNVSREVAVVPVYIARCEPAYVAYWIGASASQRWLNRMEKGVAYTGVNLEDLRKLPIDVPSIEEQREIVRRVSATFLQIDSLLNETTRAQALVKRLDRAALEKAFRGELLAPSSTELGN